MAKPTSLAIGGLLYLFPTLSYSAEGMILQNFTTHWGGIACIMIFCAAYSLVIMEETIHLRKSKPVMIAAGIIWMIVAWVYVMHGDPDTAEQAVRHNLLEFTELFLFLLAAMTYINAMEDRGIFDKLHSWLTGRRFSLLKIFWLTGVISFILSPIIDNLTTALLMSTVLMTIGGNNTRFTSLACVNVVVASNAGGVFSPFGDITTLMVWQKGMVEFQDFFMLVVPALVNWLVPASIMSCFVPRGEPTTKAQNTELKYGAWVIIGLFLLTISLAVCVHNFLHLPPVVGMMTGLGCLTLYGYVLKTKAHDEPKDTDIWVVETLDERPARPASFDIFKKLARAEWDTLMFFYGVILCVGGLGTLGYLNLLSELMYVDLGMTWANILVGFLSAIIDNIPVMFAVLSMLPDMDQGQWLLVTLTAGVGGSMLSIGSAAGVAVMGQARGVYTFLAHLKWSWSIALGYFASIGVHFLINRHLFIH